MIHASFLVILIQRFELVAFTSGGLQVFCHMLLYVGLFGLDVIDRRGQIFQLSLYLFNAVTMLLQS